MFDPVNRTWRNVNPLPEKRMQHTATLLTDGRVLVAGGTDEPFAHGRTGSYLYDPETDSWGPAMHLDFGRKGHSAATLRSGRVLVVGDTSDVSGAFVAEVFDPVSNHWTTSAELETGRFAHSTRLLPSGQLIVAAGQLPMSHPAYTVSTELFTER